MIAIIADDFTGAAEVGGIALNHGMEVVIKTRIDSQEKAELLIIVADTRNLSEQEAATKIKEITLQLLDLNPVLIFKKLDSVLRGNIASELQAQMKASNIKRTLLVAGNPTFNRFIKNGTYYIDKTPLAETHFANDKEYRSVSSSVKEIIGEEFTKVTSLNSDNELPLSGIIAGNVSTKQDMINWSLKLDSNTLAAGSAGFFDTIMKVNSDHKEVEQNNTLHLEGSALYVLGSAFPKSNIFFDEMKKDDFYISNVPQAIYENKQTNNILINEWAEKITQKIEQNIKVIITFIRPASKDENISLRLRETTGEVVRKVTQATTIDNLIIEGGATASSIFQWLDIVCLVPFNVIDTGIIQLKATNMPNLTITTKPGSYKWTKSLLQN